MRDKYGNFTDLRSYGWHIETTNPDILEPIPYPIQTTLGTSTTRITSRGLPGRVLMRAWLTKDGNKTSISTLENVLQFSVLPVLTSDDAGRNTWQTITQVLLGGIFGQTPVQGYFAGSALFAPETKMLAVSTLIDNPKTPILTVIPSGNINLGSIKYGTGLDVRIENFRENVLSLIVQDNRLGDIARVTYPPMSTDASTALCSKDETDASCDKDTFAFLPVATNTTVKNGVIYQNNQPLFSVRDILSLPNLRFTFLSQTGSSLQFAVTKDSLDFGILALRWKSRAPSTDTLNNTTYNLAMMVAGLEMKMNWNQTSSYDIPGIVVYDRDESPAYL